MKRFSPTLAILFLVLISACTTTGTKRNVDGPVSINSPATEITENQLLNVSVEIFEPGVLPESKKDATGLSMEIREAEARYMPEQLRATMEKTGFWGAVRVVPRGTAGGEVIVSGTILESDGAQLELRVTARDATGRQWFINEYSDEVEAAYYRSGGQPYDAFQPLYNTIANDLAEYRNTLTTADITTTRQVSELLFAADLAPDAFAKYLQKTENGQYTIVHLPSADDPMYRRVQAIRDRDLLMIDTLNGHFDNFHREMEQPYTEWRKSRSDEAEKLRELEKAAMTRTLVGVAAVVGAIFAGTSAGSSNDVISDALLLGGAYALKSGADKRSEAVIHRESIEELGLSFSSETQPLVVEVEGKTIELTGSAENQYIQWRKLMAQIYTTETGLPGATN